MTRLDRWALRTAPHPYRAPERCLLVLTGIVTGHRKLPDGSQMQTADLIGFDGPNVCTPKSVYELGEPDPAFLAFRAEQGLANTPEALRLSLEAAVSHNAMLFDQDGL